VRAGGDAAAQRTERYRCDASSVRWGADAGDADSVTAGGRGVSLACFLRQQNDGRNPPARAAALQ